MESLFEKQIADSAKFVNETTPLINTLEGLLAFCPDYENGYKLLDVIKETRALAITSMVIEREITCPEDLSGEKGKNLLALLSLMASKQREIEKMRKEIEEELEEDI